MKEKYPIIKQLDASEYPGTYHWCLRWIGGHFVRDEIIFNVFYFELVSEKNKGQERIIREIELESYNTAFFEIGSVFNRYGCLIVGPSNSDFSQITVRLESGQMPVSGLNFCGSANFPIPREAGIGFSYFEAVTDVGGRTVKVIIPVLAVCKYLYYSSSFIVEYILAGRISEVIEKKNENVIVVDNKKAVFNEIIGIIPYMFGYKNIGIKSLNMISSGFKAKLINNPDQNPTYYLHTSLPFHKPVDLSIIGNFCYVNDEQVFFAYSLTDVKYNVTEYMLFDKKVIPFSTIQNRDLEFLTSEIRRKRTDTSINYRGNEKQVGTGRFYNGRLHPSMNYIIRKESVHYNGEIEWPRNPSKIRLKNLASYANRIRNNARYRANTKIVGNYLGSIIGNLSGMYKTEYHTLNGMAERSRKNVLSINNIDVEITISSINKDDCYFYLVHIGFEFLFLMAYKNSYSKISDIELELIINLLARDLAGLGKFALRKLKIRQDKYYAEQSISILQIFSYDSYEKASSAQFAERDSIAISEKIELLTAS